MIERHDTVLSCGMHAVMERTRSHAVYCGIVVSAGTRHEAPEESGLAHLVEHLTFKGTSRRTARQITGLLERKGGELSAYTSKQETVYYAQVLPEDFALAADLLCDMVFQSQYPQREITKEVEVVCEEIDSYRDAPAELIFDDFESRLFPGQSLGRDVLGEPAALRNYKTADALRFASRCYLPENCVFYVYGDIDFRQTTRTLERIMGKVQLRQAPSCAHVPDLRAEGVPSPFHEEVKKETHQAHVLVGTSTFGGADKRNPTLQLLNNYLGGPAANSRFNLTLRERAGLVYTVDSYASAYPDTGIWVTYFGCDPKDVARCLRLLRQEVGKVTDDGIAPSVLQAAKHQFIRQIRLACDSYEAYSLAMGKTFADYRRHRDVNEICAKIERITPEDVLQTARACLRPDRLSTLIYR